MRKPAGTVRSMRWYPDETPESSWNRSWRVTVNPELRQCRAAVGGGHRLTVKFD